MPSKFNIPKQGVSTDPASSATRQLSRKAISSGLSEKESNTGLRVQRPASETNGANSGGTLIPGGAFSPSGSGGASQTPGGGSTSPLQPGGSGGAGAGAGGGGGGSSLPEGSGQMPSGAGQEPPQDRPPAEDPGAPRDMERGPDAAAEPDGEGGSMGVLVAGLVLIGGLVIVAGLVSPEDE